MLHHTEVRYDSVVHAGACVVDAEDRIPHVAGIFRDEVEFTDTDVDNRFHQWVTPLVVRDDARHIAVDVVGQDVSGAKPIMMVEELCYTLCAIWIIKCLCNSNYGWSVSYPSFNFI